MSTNEAATTGAQAKPRAQKAGGSGGSGQAAPSSTKVRVGTGQRTRPPQSSGALEPRALVTSPRADEDGDADTDGDEARAGTSPSSRAPKGGVQLEQVLQQMQGMMQDIRAQQMRQQAALDAMQSARDNEDARSSVSDGSASSGSASVQAARTERRKLTVNPPPTLAYSKASSGGALEDWIDAMEMFFARMGTPADDHAARLEEARTSCDRDVRAWWSGQEKHAREAGAPITTWEGFLTVLRAQFLPQSEAHEATSELINIRQAQGEAMEAYFLRATRLYARTRGGFNDGAAMLIVLERARKDEWRHALAVATREVHGKKITTLAGLRACLQREALAEPGKRGQQGGAAAGAQQRPSGGAHKKPGTLKAAAAAMRAADGGNSSDEADDTAAGTKVAAAAMPPKRADNARVYCPRCKTVGHHVRDCKQPDERKCFLCNEKGHGVATCPKRPQSKNE
jgi:hypothetical protein